MCRVWLNDCGMRWQFALDIIVICLNCFNWSALLLCGSCSCVCTCATAVVAGLSNVNMRYVHLFGWID